MNMLISILNNLIVHYMSGTSGMLPSQFNYQPKSITKRVHQAEKPVELLEEIIGYIYRFHMKLFLISLLEAVI